MSRDVVSPVDLAELRQKWLFQSLDKVPPETFAELLKTTNEILSTWYERWSNLHKQVKPTAFSTRRQRQAWLREQDWKALAVWHAMREIRAYWQKAGVWHGNPYDPEDKGTFGDDTDQ